MSQLEGASHRRARLAIVFTTLSTTAFFFASGSTQLVASAFLDVPVDAEAPASLPTVSAPSRVRGPRAAEPVLARNIFDSVTGGMEWDVPEVVVIDDGDQGPDGGVVITQTLDGPHQACEGSIRLVGSYVRLGDPEQSFAAIIGASGTSLLYRTGMAVDDRQVMLIERNRVVLAPQPNSLCDLAMFGPPPTAGGPPAAPPPVVAEAAPATDAGGVEAADLDANIHQVSDTSYTINRSLVDRLLANQAALMSAARVIPHEEDGRTVGMKIYGIRRSSLLGRLGVQNGDMLRTINGFDLSDPNAILQAYTQLRSADHLSLQIQRRGQPVSMDYQIQ